MSNGRSAPLSPTQEPFTFPSSGITIVVQHVSAQVAQDRASALRRKDIAEGRKPLPPVQTVDIAGESVTAPNPSDPDYVKALNNYEREFAVSQYKWLMQKAILDPNRELITKLVAEYRAKVLREDGIEFTEDDDHLFLWHLAALDQSDYTQAQNFALYISRPTQEAIAEAKERFRNHVQGS